MTTEIDNTIYEAYGEKWYTAYDDPVALLRAESKVKTPWILSRLKAQGLTSATILDVGCGAGFLSNELALKGYQVTGVDISAESVRVAEAHDTTGTVKYQVADAFHLPYADESFDVVTAMDFLEHVENPDKVIREFSRVLKPGGLFFFHTFNRNFIAKFLVIKMVEWLVKNTPKNMHVIELFITPQELTQYCELSGLRVFDMTGIRPKFSTIPVRNYFTGIVPKSLEFTLTRSLLLSYLGVAKKTGPGPTGM